jgi:hypothetical protein
VSRLADCQHHGAVGIQTVDHLSGYPDCVVCRGANLRMRSKVWAAMSDGISRGVNASQLPITYEARIVSL